MSDMTRAEILEKARAVRKAKGEQRAIESQVKAKLESVGVDVVSLWRECMTSQMKTGRVVSASQLNSASAFADAYVEFAKTKFNPQ